MKRRYASFLIRWWQHGAGRQRVTVSHIQSGEQVNHESLPAAFAWIADHAAAIGGEGDRGAASAPDDTAPDDDENAEGDGDGAGGRRGDGT